MPSLLEDRYPHISPTLVESWGSAERFEAAMGKLMFDSRWDRQGWPADAWAELRFLHDLHRRAYTEQYPKRFEMEDELKWF